MFSPHKPSEDLGKVDSFTTALNNEIGWGLARPVVHLEMVPSAKFPVLAPTPNHSIEMKGWSSSSQ